MSVLANRLPKSTAKPVAGFCKWVVPIGAVSEVGVLGRGATPCLPFAALRGLRWARPGAASVLSLPAVPNTRPRARGSSAGPPCRQRSPGDGQGLPGSRRAPRVRWPWSATPAGRRAPAQYGAATWPRVGEQQRRPRGVLRRSLAGRSAALFTLRRAGYPVTTPHALPAVGQALRDGLSPAGLQRKVSEWVVTLRSPFPSFAWRNPIDRSNLLRCVGPPRAEDFGLRASVERTGAQNALMRIHLGASVLRELRTSACALKVD
jgi:hypothetical protein